MEWWQVIVAAASVLAAGRLIWTKALRPIIAGADAVHDAAPVLLDLAKEWDGNGHSTLGDRIDRIEADLAVIKEAMGGQRHDLNNVKQVLLAAPWLSPGDSWRLTRYQTRPPDSPDEPPSGRGR